MKSSSEWRRTDLAEKVGTMKRISLFLGIGALALVGCDDGEPEVDAGPAVDSGAPMVCPQTGVPAPEELMGPCCWRTSNEDRQEEPEMRISYIEITEPMGSPLSLVTVRTVLNESIQEERFNWLFRIGTTAGGDGPVSITTGYGRRQADGTYAYSTGSAEGDPDSWCPVVLDGSLAGEVVNGDPVANPITVPIFDESGDNLLIELSLINLSIENSTFSESRSCIGSKRGGALRWDPAATLRGFIDVDTAIMQRLAVGTIDTTVCAALAGSITDPTYCDQPRAMWQVPPDSLCDMNGCTRNAEGMTDVCDPLNDCNAWQFGANFAAAGVDISNDVCM